MNNSQKTLLAAFCSLGLATAASASSVGSTYYIDFGTADAVNSTEIFNTFTFDNPLELKNGNTANTANPSVTLDDLKMTTGVVTTGLNLTIDPFNTGNTGDTRSFSFDEQPTGHDFVPTDVPSGFDTSVTNDFILVNNQGATTGTFGFDFVFQGLVASTEYDIEVYAGADASSVTSGAVSVTAAVATPDLYTLTASSDSSGVLEVTVSTKNITPDYPWENVSVSFMSISEVTSATAIPSPTAAVVGLAGFAGLIARRRRRSA